MVGELQLLILEFPQNIADEALIVEGATQN